MKLEKNLDLYLGSILEESFHIKEIIKIVTLILLEKQVHFNSYYRDKISKVMFAIHSLLPDDLPWQNFFIPIKPTILSQESSLPILAGGQGQYTVDIDKGMLVGEKVGVPSFLLELKYSNFVSFKNDLAQKIYENGAMKSQLWVDIVHRQ